MKGNKKNRGGLIDAIQNDRRVDRRAFLRQMGCAGLGSTALFSALTHLGAITAAASTGPDGGNLGATTRAPGGDYKALVCILFAGGNDSFNMVVPNDDPTYAEYATVRADLALARETLVPLTNLDGADPLLGLHPGMEPLRDLYNQGDAAIVANVGTLVEPVTLQGLLNGTAKEPLGLYSHADQIAQWQTSLPDARSAVGWGGRLADSLSAINGDAQISMNITLAGNNVFQAGNTVVEYAVTPDGAPALFGYGDTDFYGAIKTTAIDGMLNAAYRNIFERAYAARLRTAIDSQVLFTEAIDGITPIQAPFSNSGLSKDLEMIAKTIAARDGLGMRRQTFFVLVGGWDHHDGTLDKQARKLPGVAESLAEFYAALQEMQVHNDVTTFTISDFGRTLTSNGQGSDHGWGGNHLVMGGAVDGGKIYGEFPSLFAGNDLDTGRGRLIPTLSVDEYFAELALWFGADPSALDSVLPNIGRFYTPGTGAPPPIGFF